ncbi:MAG: acyltransferase [Crocinitomicaceae bacterium]|nr:acyltransferase [Crocinitomicaceae bacterium]
MSTSTPKIAILDSARGVCAFIVALYHFLHFENQYGSFVSPDNAILEFVDPFIHGSICVFFIISGYVMYMHLERYNYSLSLFIPFILKRIVRIMVPMIICVLCILAINALFQVYLGEPVLFSAKQLIANLTLTANFVGEEWYNPIFWTLSVEFQFYLFLGFAFMLIRKYPFASLMFLVVASLSANYFWDLRGTFIEFTSYFAVGIALILFSKKTYSAVQLLAIIGIGSADFFLNQALFYCVIPLISIPVILFVETKSKLLEFAGVTSYSFYLMHGILGGWFLYFTLRYADSALFKFALILGAFAVAYFGSYLFYILVEKPSLKLVRRIRYNQTN